MKTEYRKLLEEYKELGTPEQIRRRMGNPYPEADEGYAPRVNLSDMFLPDFQCAAGLCEDDGEGMIQI